MTVPLPTVPRMLIQNSPLAIETTGIKSVVRVLSVCFAVILLMVTWTDESFGQRSRQKKVKLMIGDIIEYDDFRDGSTYGLVVELKPFLKVEKFDRSGDIEDTVVQPNRQYRVIDRARKKKTSTNRTWKSSDGKFNIEASLAGVEDGKARLKKDNGKIVSVPVNKLSKKDREYLERKENEDPFGDEVEDHPEEVFDLIERRNALMADQELHNRLAKQSANMMIGDIIKYESFPDGVAFGIVKSLGFHGVIETVDENGNLENDRITGNSRWWFVDREPAPIVNRTWKSSDGKFKIEARLIEIEDGNKLVLEKPSGKTITVPLSKLGKADESYVKRNRAKLSMANKSPLIAARENYGPELQQLLARRAELMEFVADRNVAANDAAKMKSIGLNVKPLNFTANEFKPLSLKDNSFSNSFSMNVPEHGRIEHLSYSEQAGLVAFAISSPFGGAPVLAVADVESGDVITNVDEDATLGEDAQVLSISPSGETILVYSKEDFRSKNLELWKHLDGGLKRINVVPYSTFWAPRAHLLSDTNGIILSDKGDLVFFDMDDRIKPTHLVQGGSRHGGNHVQISDDQKSIFYFGSAGSSLHVIDLETRKCVGGMSLGQGDFSAFAQISADGKTATYLRNKDLMLFDLQSGEVIGEHKLPETVTATTADRLGFPMLSPTLIRTFHGSLYDINLETEIGEIEGNSFGAQYYSNSTRIVGKIDRMGTSSRGGFSGRLLGAGGGGGGRSGGGRSVGDRSSKTVEVRYEKLDIDSITNFANSLTEDDIVTFGHGDKVKLDLDLGDRRVEDELDRLIFDTMDEAGIDVVDRSDFVLEVRYSEGKPQTEEFRIVGGPTERRRTVTITPKTCSAKLKYRGEVIWSRASSASLGRPYSEEQLNEIIKRAKSINARTLLDYDYPNDLRKLPPSKQRTFSWK